MPTGSLRFQITDLVDGPIDGQLDLEFQPANNSPVGTLMETSFPGAGETDFTIEGIQEMLCTP